MRYFNHHRRLIVAMLASVGILFASCAPRQERSEPQALAPIDEPPPPPKPIEKTDDAVSYLLANGTQQHEVEEILASIDQIDRAEKVEGLALFGFAKDLAKGSLPGGKTDFMVCARAQAAAIVKLGVGTCFAVRGRKLKLLRVAGVGLVVEASVSVLFIVYRDFGYNQSYFGFGVGFGVPKFGLPFFGVEGLVGHSSYFGGIGVVGFSIGPKIGIAIETMIISDVFRKKRSLPKSKSKDAGESDDSEDSDD